MAASLKEAKTGSCVSCPRCSYEIALASKLRLPGEFSVMCPNCGHRGVYQAAETHDPKPDVETARTLPRSIPFSTGKKESMQPKSWLNAWTSSL